MAKTWLLRRRHHFRDLRSEVSVFRQREQSPMGMHRHEFVEIVVVMAGWGLHATGAVRHEIGAGDVMVIHGRRSHAYVETRKLHLVNILLREEFFEGTAQKLGALPGYHPLFTFEFARWKPGQFAGRLRLSAADLKNAAEWIEAMEGESAAGTEEGNFLASLWSCHLLAMLARRYEKAASLSPDLDTRLGRVLARMDRSPGEAFALGEMAKESRMSERSFLRYFKRATGLTPVDYMIRARVRLADELLLQDPAASITEIAFRCGFSDSNYFARQFRRVKGETPRAYRKRAG